MDDGPIRLGVSGCGGFGLFALQHFAQVPGVKFVGLDGVHFFDLLAGWFGPGRVEAAQVGVRPGTAIEEHVHATVRYGAALVNFYHGFHQAGRMDRQELRLVFERGDVTLYDWVPTRARVHALVDERQTRDLFPGSRLDVIASYARNDRACRGRDQAIDAYQVIGLSFGDGQAKSPLCGRLLRAMMADQAAWIRDRNHRRVVTEANGRDSLATACEADALAHRARADR
jgi:predicted dehydrogenase